jgi:hypothetical protein
MASMIALPGIAGREDQNERCRRETNQHIGEGGSEVARGLAMPVSQLTRERDTAMLEEKTTRGDKYKGLVRLIKTALEIIEQDIKSIGEMDEELGNGRLRTAGDKCKVLLQELEEELATIVLCIEETPEQSSTENCNSSGV